MSKKVIFLSVIILAQIAVVIGAFIWAAALGSAFLSAVGLTCSMGIVNFLVGIVLLEVIFDIIGSILGVIILIFVASVMFFLNL